MRSPARISEFLEMRMPEGLDRQTEDAAEAGGAGAFFPKTVSDGPCKEVIQRDDFSLD